MPTKKTEPSKLQKKAALKASNLVNQIDPYSNPRFVQQLGGLAGLGGYNNAFPEAYGGHSLLQALALAQKTRYQNSGGKSLPPGSRLTELFPAWGIGEPK